MTAMNTKLCGRGALLVCMRIINSTKALSILAMLFH
jgi:hypothetical protein